MGRGGRSSAEISASKEGGASDVAATARAAPQPRTAGPATRAFFSWIHLSPRAAVNATSLTYIYTHISHTHTHTDTHTRTHTHTQREREGGETEREILSLRETEEWRDPGRACEKGTEGWERRRGE